MESRELATKRDYQRWIKNARALAEHLRSDEVKGHFDMNHWYSHDDNDHKHNIKSPTDVLNHCGTSACAWGHAATMPLFIRQGLKYVHHKGRITDGGWEVNSVPDDDHHGCENKKKYEGLEYDYDWSHHLFGAIYDYDKMNETSHLFGDGVDRTPKQEARVLDGHASMLEREMNKRWSA